MAYTFGNKTSPLASDFDRFGVELSSQLAHAADFAGAIRSALQHIGGALGIDRCVFTRLSTSGDPVAPIVWSAPDIPAAPPPSLLPSRIPWTLGQLLAGQRVCFASLDEIPSEDDRATLAAMATKSAVYIPMSVAGHVAGVLGFTTIRAARTWSPDVVSRLMVFAGVFEQVLARQLRSEARANADEVRRSRELDRDRHSAIDVIGQSAGIRTVLTLVAQVAQTDATVLLLGETGTGKELFATRIHELGTRRGRPMVRVNCGAIPYALIESELFGRERGAFTGALARQIGRFELADHATIFLDEIGDLPSEVQVKLLRMLEERQIERLGSPSPIHIDTRIIAATHRNLDERIAEGAFREDLYYRLNVFPIHIPPLRERSEDIPLLVWRFVENFCHSFGKRVDSIDDDSLAALQAYNWPGNVRELKNVVERAMILAHGRRLSISPPLPVATAAPASKSPRLLDVEKEHIRTVVESAGWRVRGAGGAAERLGLKPTTLETRLARLGLKRPGRS